MSQVELSVEEDKALAYQMDGDCGTDRSERIQLLEKFVEQGGERKVLKAIAWKFHLSPENDNVTEAVQDAMFKCFQYVANGRFHYRGYPFSAFVKTVARHCFLRNEAYRKRYIQFSEFESDDENETEPYQVVDLSNELDRLEFEISLRQSLRLPEKHFRIFMGQLFFSKSCSEIAQEEHMSEVAVRKVLSRIKQKIRESFLSVYGEF